MGPGLGSGVACRPQWGPARQLRHSRGTTWYVDRILAAVRPDDPSAPLEDDDVASLLPPRDQWAEPAGVAAGSALIASAKATDTRLGGPSLGHGLPAHHVAGLQVLVRAHLSGIPPIPLDTVGGAGATPLRSSANATRAARAIADSDGAQLRTALVPTQLARIVESWPSSSGCPRCLRHDLIRWSGGRVRTSGAGNEPCTNCHHHGMTETSGGCVYDGTPLAGVAVRIVDADDSGVEPHRTCRTDRCARIPTSPELTRGSVRFRNAPHQ